MREIKLTVHGDTVHASQYLAGVRGSANATTLVVTFDESWDGYAKQIVFWDALDQNPVTRILTADLLADPANDTRTYKTAIPGEALAVAGECILAIEGWRDNTRLRAMQLRLVVEYAPHTEPANPTPDQYAQLQLQIEVLTDRTQTVAQGVEEVREIALHFDGVVQGATETINEALGNANTAAVAANQSANAAAASEQASAEHRAGADEAKELAKKSAESAAGFEQNAEAHKTAAEAAKAGAQEAEQGAIAAAGRAEGYTSHPPICGDNGNWWLWDGTQYTDSGRPSQGEDATTRIVGEVVDGTLCLYAESGALIHAEVKDGTMCIG